MMLALRIRQGAATSLITEAEILRACDENNLCCYGARLRPDHGNGGHDGRRLYRVIGPLPVHLAGCFCCNAAANVHSGFIYDPGQSGE
jgi:hypothetical protein